MIRYRTGGAVLCLWVAAGACSATVDPEAFVAACVVGETAHCECDDGAEGAKTCRADGAFGDCDCRVVGGGEGVGGGCGGRGGEPCDVPALGPCAEGVLRCVDGVLNCESLHSPVPERCNGVDDNCDGAVDEGDPGSGEDCQTGLEGECAAGPSVCYDGRLTCAQTTALAGETCDGLDNDCDGETDEEAPGQCVLCDADPAVDASALGLCSGGVSVCMDGAMRCVPLLPPDWAPGAGCDGLDSDCDGMVDEAGDPAVDAAVEGVPPAPERLARAREVCGSPARGPDPREPCNEDPATELWSCEPGEGGGICTAARCSPGRRIEDDRCVPDVERCNDGIDDDGDGLIDGTVDGPDPCAAIIDQGDAALRMGRCRTDDVAEGCQGSEFMGEHAQTYTHCEAPNCPHLVTLSYRYAVDREEVSVRAYLECVRSGCCAPASGLIWSLAQERLAQGPTGRRPDSHERCEAPPPLAPGMAETAERILDLPVVGVTWCQARDYCNWVGKRLLTEYEWERAAVGMDPEGFRKWSWGNDVAARCGAEQCCQAEGFEWDPADPGACDPTAASLPVCREAPPEEVRSACLATLADPHGACDRYDPERDCPGCVFGPAPVWANEDGATPEGVLNMTGNVYEWVYDWWARTYDGNNAVDPVGVGCDPTVAGGQRIMRGGGMLTDARTSNSLRRQQGLPSGKLGYVGFRCGRTLPEGGGACDPQMPEAPGRCAPPRVWPACDAPLLDGDDAGDLAPCPQGREHSTSCTAGLDRFCATDEGPGCDALVVKTMRFEGEILEDFVRPALLREAGVNVDELFHRDTAAIMNGFIEGLLATSGGETVFMLDLPGDFGGNLTYRGALGNVIRDGQGRQRWLGLLDGVECVPTDRFDLAIPTTELELDFEALCMRDRGALWMIEAPISFAYSGVALRGERTEQGLQTSMLGFVTLEDAARATFGDPDNADDVLLRARMHPLDLCPLVGVLGCEPLPGCEGAGVDSRCDEDDLRCNGWPLPLFVEAVRREHLNLPGLGACEAPGPD